MRRKDLLGQFLPKARAKGFFDSLRDLILEEPVFLPDYRDFVFQPQIFNGNFTDGSIAELSLDCAFVEEGDTAAGGYQILDGLHVLNFRFVFKIRYKEPPLFQNLLQNHPGSRARFPQQKPLSCQLLQGEREALLFLHTFHLKKEIRAADRNERFSQVDQIGVGGLGEISLQQGEIQRAVVDLRQQVSRILDSH